MRNTCNSQLFFVYLPPNISINLYKKLMKRFCLSMIMLSMMALFFNVNAANNQELRVVYGNTQMAIALSDYPKIVKEGSNIIVKTSYSSETLTLPCKFSFINSSSTAINEVVNILNNNDEPLTVFSLDGKKVAVLKDKSELISLKRGVYIVNGKKIMIK